MTTNDQMLAPNNKSKLVVAVDDAAENLLLIEGAISPDGYSFIGLGSGEDCVNMLSRVTPRLVLLDIEMPGMSGLDVCRRLRTYQHLHLVPIVFLTVRNQVDDVRTGMAAGGNDFIVKPFEPAKLQERVRYWLKQRVYKGQRAAHTPLNVPGPSSVLGGTAKTTPGEPIPQD
jgi:two-component system, OmpR family, response regulator